MISRNELLLGFELWRSNHSSELIYEQATSHQLDITGIAGLRLTILLVVSRASGGYLAHWYKRLYTLVVVSEAKWIHRTIAKKRRLQR
jgi:hypothetical protein